MNFSAKITNNINRITDLIHNKIFFVHLPPQGETGKHTLEFRQGVSMCTTTLRSGPTDPERAGALLPLPPETPGAGWTGSSEVASRD